VKFNATSHKKLEFLTGVPSRTISHPLLVITPAFSTEFVNPVVADKSTAIIWSSDLELK